MSTDDLDNMPRMLPPSEIESLRRDKEEAGAWLMQQMKKDQLPDQSEPRMLTKAEIELLRQNKQELARQIIPLIKR